MNLQHLPNDLHNGRYTTIEDIPCVIDKKLYNIFFEFSNYAPHRYRTTNKRTGAPLKKPVYECIKASALAIDTSCDTTEYMCDGTPYRSCYRVSRIEKPVYEEMPDFSRRSILHVVNQYATAFYKAVVIIEEAAAEIIRKNGGARELEILHTDSVCKVDRETWNDEHKVVYVYARRENKLAERCEVDLVTGLICG